MKDKSTGEHWEVIGTGVSGRVTAKPPSNGQSEYKHASSEAPKNVGRL